MPGPAQAASADSQFTASLFNGSAPTAQQVNLGATAVSTTVLAILGPAAAAGPIGIAIGGAVLAIGALSGKIAHLIDGCGESCTYATEVVNQAGALVEQIKSAYWQAPIRTRSFQKWTLDQLGIIFAKIRTLCDPAKLGDAGTRCINERLVRGAHAPWCPADGPACDFYTVTYDPIANDPGVSPDPASVEGIVAAVTGIFSSNPVSGGYGTMVVAGLALFAFVAYKVRA